MNSIIIKQCGKPGRDAKMFRAYALQPPEVGVCQSSRRKDEPLGVSASTTGNPSYGIIKCAAKAFLKTIEPKGELDEIETRVAIVAISEDLGIWRADLTPKNVCYKPGTCHCPACWLERQQP